MISNNTYRDKRLVRPSNVVTGKAGAMVEMLLIQNRWGKKSRVKSSIGIPCLALADEPALDEDLYIYVQNSCIHYSLSSQMDLFLSPHSLFLGPVQQHMSAHFVYQGTKHRCYVYTYLMSPRAFQSTHVTEPVPIAHTKTSSWRNWSRRCLRHRRGFRY